MSAAIRAAISLRVKSWMFWLIDFMDVANRLSMICSENRFPPGSSPGRLRFRLAPRGFDLDHSLDEDAGRHDRLGIEVADADHLRDLRDGAFGGGRHDRTEIACGLAIDEVAERVALGALMKA